MAAGLWSTNGAALAYALSAFGDMEPQVRGVSLALVNALGNLSQIYGSVRATLQSSSNRFKKLTIDIVPFPVIGCT
jgi:hypothetical protein